MAIVDKPSREWTDPFTQLVIGRVHPLSGGLASVDMCEALDAASELPCGCLPIRECECQRKEPRQASA